MSLVLGVVAFSQMVRGFGRAVFDALLLYGALYAAEYEARPLAAQVCLVHGAAVNHADLYALLLVVFGALALALSSFVYGLTLMDLGMFDKLLGLCAGVAAGMMIAHGIVHAMAMADPDGSAGAATVASSTVGNEMLDYPGYHAVMDTITGATSYHREFTDVSGK